MSKLTLPDSFGNLPASVEKMQKLFMQESVSSDALVIILENEPLLSANILKLVNSVHYGLSRKITSVRHALMLLGTTIIRGIIMATVLKKAFPVDLCPYNITLDDFDKICIARSRVLGLWMKEEAVDLPTLSSVAFLMESGKIIMAQAIVKNNSVDAFHALLEEFSVEEAEQKLFEVSSYEAAAKLFEAWFFSEEFTTLIAGSLTPISQEQKVLYVLIGLINTQEMMSESSIALALERAEEFGFDGAKLLDAVKKIQKDL